MFNSTGEKNRIGNEQREGILRREWTLDHALAIAMNSKAAVELVAKSKANSRQEPAQANTYIAPDMTVVNQVSASTAAEAEPQVVITTDTENLGRLEQIRRQVEAIHDQEIN